MAKLGAWFWKILNFVFQVLVKNIKKKTFIEVYIPS